MSGSRCAALVGPSEPLAPTLAATLETCGYAVEIVPGSTFDDLDQASLESTLTNLLPQEVDGLVIGDRVFPPAQDPDEGIRMGLLTSFVAVKIVLRTMMRKRHGRIVAIAPPLGREEVSHHALRGGLSALIKSVAREVGSRGVLANVIAPGHLAGESDPLSSYVAQARPAEAIDIAGALSFCVGESSSYFTGQVLMVDGGLTTS